MIKKQIEARGIKDKNVLKAIDVVPRHLFVPNEFISRAYDDSALPIGYDQTISQPYIVAHMCEAANLSPNARVLEIGTGLGYQTAVLSQIVKEVYTIEIVRDLGALAEIGLQELGYENVYVKIGDGYAGWPENGPYDAILITAVVKEIPPALLDQLALNGKLIAPLGSGESQELICFLKLRDSLIKTSLGAVRFVPFQRGAAHCQK
jgi:protein-L-isoaspartate(D-aspartate) O-methyltransferase